MRIMSARRLAITSALVVGAFGVSVAFAAWTSTGTGNTEAKSLTATTLTVSVRAATADLYPGFTQGDVYFSVANTNPYPVTLTSAAFGAVASSDTAACPSSNVTIAAATGLTLVVPAGATATPLTIANVVTMATAAPDGCQNKTFTIPVTLNGAQS